MPCHSTAIRSDADEPVFWRANLGNCLQGFNMQLWFMWIIEGRVSVMILRKVQYAVMLYLDYRALCVTIVQKASRQSHEIICTTSAFCH
jgi:hypothetical protein